MTETKRMTLDQSEIYHLFAAIAWRRLSLEEEHANERTRWQTDEEHAKSLTTLAKLEDFTVGALGPLVLESQA